MPEQHPDQRLIEGLAKNDYEVLKEIDNKYRPILISWILKNSGSREDAEDIYQDTIIAIFDRICQDKPLILTRPFSAYLMGVGTKKWYEVLRSRKKEVKVMNDQLKQYIDEIDESVEEELVQIEHSSERHRQLDRTFMQLSKLCQSLLQMVFYRGLSADEIVQALEFSNHNAYYVRKKKCLDRWRFLLSNA